MTKISRYMGISLILAMLATGCGSRPFFDASSQPELNPEGDRQEEPAPQDALPFISLYFLEPGGKLLFPLSFSYSSQDAPEDLIRALHSGPPRKEWGKSPIPEGITIEKVSITGGKALVNLKPDNPQIEIDPKDEEILVVSLVYSLTSLPGLLGVEFLQEGEKPRDPFSLLARKNHYAPQDLALNPLEGAEAAEKFVRLWFSNKDILYMVPVSLALAEDCRDSRELALFLIQSLMEGPGQESGLISCFPKGSEILSLQITGRVLEVNFNEAFRDNFAGGSAQEWAIINSLVLTLTEIEGVDEVQILIEGRREEAALGHMDTGEPIFRGVVNWVMTD